MSETPVIFITGPPASGKTHVAAEAGPALDLGGPIVIVDTTDLPTIDLESLVPACAAHVEVGATSVKGTR